MLHVHTSTQWKFFVVGNQRIRHDRAALLLKYPSMSYCEGAERITFSTGPCIIGLPKHRPNHQ